MDLGLKGKVAIVAAASKGLGRAVAEEFAKEGCEVAICARTAADVEQTGREIEKASGRAVLCEAMDVTNADAVRRFVDTVEKKFGRVDICVTNAGGPPAKRFLDITLEDWRTAVELTLLSSVYFAREVLPRMQRNHWGRFITITSVSVKQPINGLLLSNSLRAVKAWRDHSVRPAAFTGTAQVTACFTWSGASGMRLPIQISSEKAAAVASIFMPEMTMPLSSSRTTCKVGTGRLRFS